MEDYNKNIALFIKGLRQQKNISQHIVAKALNCSDSAYCRLENRETELTVNQLFAIAHVLKTDVIDILQLPKQRNERFINITISAKELQKLMIKSLADIGKKKIMKKNSDVSS